MTTQGLSSVAPGVAIPKTPTQWVLFSTLVIVGGMLATHLIAGMGAGSPLGSADGNNSTNGEGSGGTSDDVGRDLPVANLSVSGDAISVLSPGTTSPIHISITNQNDHSVIIDRLSVTVQVESAPSATSALPCSVDDFSIGQFSGSFPLVIPARSMTSLADLGIPQAQWPVVEMVQGLSNQNGCQLASLSLGFTASGTPSV